MKDLIGKKFNNLTVIKFSHKDNRLKPFWLCKCECGNEKIIREDCFICGGTQSCGCILSNLARNKLIKHNTTHGLSHTRLNKEWRGIKYRSQIGYSTICNEWSDDFKAFHDWAIKNGYADNLTIDRIDNNRGYEPSNCRWITIQEQQRNKQNNIFVNGKHLKDWSAELGIKYHTLFQRYRINSSPEYVLRPKRGKKV